MKISEKQLMQLIAVAEQVVYSSIYPQSYRDLVANVLTEINDQQSEELKDVGDE